MGNCYVSFVPACGNKEKPTAAAVKEGDSLPDMRTTGVTTLVSDSGMIRYKIITAEWLIYSHRNPPFWRLKKESIWKNSTVFSM